MLDSIKSFFRSHMAPGPDQGPEAAEQRARLAAAALLVEVVRSDDEFSEVEREAVLAAARGKFGISEPESQQLIALAEAQASEAHDLYQFTSQINNTFPEARKAQLLEELWRVAYADDVLKDYEEHVIRRVADLLHLRHSTFIAAKLRAQLDRDDTPD